MLINNWDIKEAGAKQWSVTPAMSGLSNTSEWMTGHMRPVVLRSDLTWKPLKVVVQVKGKSREEIWERISEITSRMVDPVELVLDGFHNTFYGYLKQTSVAEKNLRGSRKWADLTLTMQVCEYSETMEIMSEGNHIQISNRGNARSPMSISFRVKQTILNRGTAMTITGLAGNDITFKSLREGFSFIADSIDGKYQYLPEDKQLTAFRINQSIIGSDEVIGGSMTNRITDLNLWEAPAVKPGISEILFLDEYGEVIQDLSEYIEDIFIRVKPMYV